MSGHLDLEALSATLDGEPADDAEHLTACATCRRRLARLEAAAAAVASPVEASPPDRRTATLSAGLEAWAEQWQAPSPDATATPARRAAGRPLRSPWPAVAAVLVLLVLAVPLVVALRGDQPGGQDVASSAGGGQDQARSAAPPGPGAAADEGPAAAESAPVEGHDLGDLGRPPALAALAPTVRAALAAGAPPPPAALRACEPAARAAVGGAAAVWAGQGRSGAVPVLVYAFASPEGAEGGGGVVLVATARDECRVLATASG